MKERLINFFIAVGISLVFILALVLITWLVVLVCDLVGKWVLLLLVVFFLWLVWCIYHGLERIDDEIGGGDNE